MTWKKLVTTARFVLLPALRLYPRLDRGQPNDQGGFRRSLQTLDQIATYKSPEQRWRERRIKMWIAMVDFAKAFDTIKHKALWTALAHFGIESHYICVLQRCTC